MNPDKNAVRTYLTGLQDRLTATLEAADGGARFGRDPWQRPGGGGGESRVLKDGNLFEQAGVGFSHVFGSSLPPAATQARPDLAGASFEALGVSLVLHPSNPYVPITHMNVRFFIAEKAGVAVAWWFGGLFFDDLADGGFERCFAFQQAVGSAFLDAYLPIVARRREHAFGNRERSFQLYRRGRYVEFNLAFDRGTLFGLQSGGRTESILMSLPPLARWEYGWRAEPGSPEARLASDYLRPRDWLAELG